MSNESEPKRKDRKDIDDPEQEWQWRQLERRLNGEDNNPHVPVRETRKETEQLLDHLWP